MSSTEVHDPYLDGRIPAEIADNLKEIFPGISYEELLSLQESAYQSIQASSRDDKTSDQTESHSSDQTESHSSRSYSSGQIGESSQRESVESQLSSQRESVESQLSSQRASIESQLALDEAIARSLHLQDLGQESDDAYNSEESSNAAATRESISSEIPNRVLVARQDVRQDDIDPDNMTYEQLQSLGESVGHETKGLAEDLISRLPTYKFKSGLFSKKKREDCVICCMAYRKGQRLYILPCAHRYHSECITRWLKINKICPVCQKEVVDD